MPGSLQIVDGPGAGALTDAPGDDRGEVVPLPPPDAPGGPAVPTVRVRLGTNPTAGAGGTIAAGATTTVKFRAIATAAAAGTTVRNQARLAYSPATIGGNLTYVGNQTADPVSTSADLQVVKTSSPDPAVAGGPLTSTISVTNAGPSPATGVVVTDTMGPGVAPSSATMPGGTCGAPSGQTVTCTIATLLAGATATMTVNATVPPGSTIAAAPDTANATSTVTDPDPSNNTAGASVDVTSRADLRIAKTVDNPTPAPGEPFTYSVSVTNDGPSVARSVVVSDVIDGRLAPSQDLPVSCTTNSGSATCALGDLNPGETRTGSFSVALVDGVIAGTAVPNTATVDSLTPDTDTVDNTSTVTITAAAPVPTCRSPSPARPPSIAGGNAVYTIDVENAGPSTATAVVVTDDLPDGATAVAAASSRGACSPTPAPSCLLGDLPAGGTARITVTVAYDPDAPLGAALDTAGVESPTTDPNAANNEASASTSITGVSDVSISKTATPLLVVAGGTVTYTLTVKNDGPSTAHDTVVTDTLPTDVTAGTVTPDQGTCTAEDATVSCTLGDVAVGDSVDITIVADVDPGFPGGDLTNVSTVGTSNDDPDPSDDAASFTNTSGAAADVAVVKTAAPDPLVSGLPATWTAVVSNAGPSDAANVVFTDLLPPGLDPATVVATRPGGTCTVADGIVTCALGTVASNAAVTITITGTLLPGGEAGPRAVNVARATTTTTDPTDSNNVAAVASDVIEQADVTITKTVAPTPIPSGVPTLATLVVTNNGPSTARGVTVVDTYNGDAAAQFDPDFCHLTPNGELECATPDLLPNTGFNLFFVLVPFDAPGTYVNSANVATTTPESDPDNNTDTADVTLGAPQVELSMDKAAAGPIVAGGRFEYGLTVTNGGPSIPQTITVTDVLPPGLVPDGVSTPGGACSISGQTVTCDLPVVVPTVFGGEPVPITIVGAVAPGIATASVTNTATAAAIGDPDGATGSTTDAVQRVADVTVTKVAETATFVAGGDVVYDVTVTNAGPSDATTAALTDVIPLGMTFDPALSDPSCADASGTVTCSLASIPAGSSVVFRIGGHLDPSFTDPSVVNTATFDSDANDPVATDPITTSVEQLADLGVTKVAVQDAFAAGGQAEFTITVTNDGPSTARDLVLDDLVPAGTTLAVVRPAAPLTCTALPCDVGDLVAGDSASIDVVVDVPASFPPGTITNTAQVDSPTPDPNPARRVDTATTQIQRKADITVIKDLLTDPLVAGEPVTYSLTLRNDGPSDALDATITDALPAGTTLLEGSIGGGPPCVQTDIDAVVTVSCVAPSVAVGQTVTGTLTLATSADLVGPLGNTAVAGAQALDEDDAGNTSFVQGLVAQPTTTTTTTTTTTAPPVTVAPTTTAPATTTTTTTTTTTIPSAPPTTARRGSGGGGGSLPATGVAIGVLLVLAGGFVLFGTSLRTAVVDRSRRRRRR